MTQQIRTVPAARGWAWMVEGFGLLMRSPGTWLLLLLLLFVAKKVLFIVPSPGLAALLSIVAMLLFPVFMAGLLEGCRELEAGRRLAIAHLFAGFRKNSAHLVTIGGISLVGNLLIIMVMFLMSGDAMKEIVQAMSANPTITPQIAQQLQGATLKVTQAALVGTTLSLPVLMAVWYAPPLVHFDGVTPLQALRQSFVACLRNVWPMLVYGGVLFILLIVLLPLGMSLGVYDLALLLLLLIVLPSVYTSYKDVFQPAGAVAAGNPLLK